VVECVGAGGGKGTVGRKQVWFVLVFYGCVDDKSNPEGSRFFEWRVEKVDQGHLEKFEFCNSYLKYLHLRLCVWRKVQEVHGEVLDGTYRTFLRAWSVK